MLQSLIPKQIRMYDMIIDKSLSLPYPYGLEQHTSRHSTEFD
jgi:hypothetical protein